MAFLASIITNLALSIHREKNEEPKYTTPEDFMPDWGEEKEEGKTKKQQSIDEMKLQMYSIAKVFKGNRKLKTRPKKK